MYKPLVSIIIVTYNSSKFIVDALESAKKQTYQNIELIISDDFSKDNTLAICENWIANNAERFVNVDLITTDKNSGISANCNRGAKKAQGEWFKIIGGDDLLAENAIELVVDFASKKNNIKLITGRYQTFTCINNQFNIDTMQRPGDKKIQFFNEPPEKQLQWLLTATDLGISPGTFARTEVLYKYGFFNEDFPFLEDLPFFVNLSKNGVQFHLLNKTVTYYRKEHGSVLKSSTQYFNLKYKESLFNFKKSIAYKIVPKTNVLYYQNELVEYLHYQIMTIIFRNKKNRLTFIVGKIIQLFSVKLVVSKIKKFHF